MAKKNTDETILDVQEVYSKSEEFFENNKGLILGILGAIILGAVAFIAYNQWVKAPALTKANERIAVAEAYWLMDSIELAVQGDPESEWDGIGEIAEDFGSSNGVGRRANYMMGIYKRDQKDFEKALEYFKTAGFDTPILGAFVSGNTGDCLVEQGAAIDAIWKGEGNSDPKALNLYEEALPYFVRAAESSVDEMTTSVYYKKAANVCLKLGKYGQAERMYDGIIEVSSSATSADYKDALRMKAMCAAQQLAN